MVTTGKLLKKLGGCALCCVAAAAAVAGPPTGNSPSGLRASGLLAAMPSRRAEGRVDFQALDLRPPETLSGGRTSAPIGDSPAAFPSAKRALLGETSGIEADLPGGGNVATLRMENKVQEMERRVPREGLPVARLWETKTALLHVGLSRRASPGCG
jgi:hypothetical protein